MLLIVENAPVPFDRRVWQEARTLQDAGYRVSVIAPRLPEQLARETLDGIDVYRHPPLPQGTGLGGYALEYATALLWETFLTCRVFLRSGLDAVHVSNPPDTLFLIGGTFKLLFGTRFIFDHHDLCPELYEVKFGRRGIGHRLLSWLEKSSVSAADMVISTNESYRQRVITRHGKDPSRVVVVRNGPDLDRVRLVAPLPSLRHGRAALVGYVGMIGVQDGLDYLVRVAVHVVHHLKRTDIHFLVIGDGPGLPEVKALATRLAVEEFFTFTGRLTGLPLMENLSTIDIGVVPDPINGLTDKSTMVKIMEYMALGKPVLQFDATEGRVSAGTASVYAEPNDVTDFAVKLVRLVDSPEQRATMGRIGEQRVRDELSWAHQAPKLLAAYRALWPVEQAQDAVNVASSPSAI